MHALKLAAAVVAYAGSILLANAVTDRYGLVSVPGTGLAVLAGTYAAGFALFARDFVHRYGGTAFAFLAVLLGAAASFVVADPALALASAVAFLVAEIVDLFAFLPTRARFGFVAAVVVSSIVSAPVDTVAFLELAGFGVTWDAVLGQTVAKVVYATVIPLLLLLVVVGAADRVLEGEVAA